MFTRSTGVVRCRLSGGAAVVGVGRVAFGQCEHLRPARSPGIPDSPLHGDRRTRWVAPAPSDGYSRRSEPCRPSRSDVVPSDDPRRRHPRSRRRRSSQCRCVHVLDLAREQVRSGRVGERVSAEPAIHGPSANTSSSKSAGVIRAARCVAGHDRAFRSGLLKTLSGPLPGWRCARPPQRAAGQLTCRRSRSRTRWRRRRGCRRSSSRRRGRHRRPSSCLGVVLEGVVDLPVVREVVVERVGVATRCRSRCRRSRRRCRCW